jgi:hypothetical protein
MEKEETEEKLFFRYQKIDDYTKDNLKKNVLYFNDPENFNDPFDCKIDITLEGTKEDWLNYLLRNRRPSEINQLIKDKKIKRKKNFYILNRTKINNELGEEFFEKSPHRVCCFSATKLNILMWSHYAENHEGICLCFRTHKIGNGHFLTLDSIPHILFPVKYDKEKPKIVNMLYEEQYIKLMDFILTKYSDWDYETEYRIPILKDKFVQGYTKKFNKEDLEGVIFGLNAKPEKIKEIYEIINAHYLQQDIKVNFYSTHKIQGEFAIEVKKIESISKYLTNLR